MASLIGYSIRFVSVLYFAFLALHSSLLSLLHFFCRRDDSSFPIPNCASCLVHLICGNTCPYHPDAYRHQAAGRYLFQSMFQPQLSKTGYKLIIQGVVYLGTEWSNNPVVRSDIVVSEFLDSVGGYRHKERRDRLLGILDVDLDWCVESYSPMLRLIELMWDRHMHQAS